MKTRIIYASVGIAIGLSFGLWIGTPTESDADRLVRLKAEVAAYEVKNAIHQWEWEDFVKMKGEIAVLESRTNNLERK